MTEIPQPIDSPPVPKADNLKGLKREGVLSTAKSLYERLSATFPDALIKSPEQDRQELEYLKRLVKAKSGKLDLSGHHNVALNDPDKLWLTVNVLYPQKEAETAYYIIQAAQIASLGGTAGKMDAKTIHQELLKPESQSVLTGLNSRQIIYGENASLRLLNEQAAILRKEIVAEPEIPQPTTPKLRRWRDPTPEDVRLPEEYSIPPSKKDFKLGDPMPATDWDTRGLIVWNRGALDRWLGIIEDKIGDRPVVPKIFLSEIASKTADPDVSAGRELGDIIVHAGVTPTGEAIQVLVDFCQDEVLREIVLEIQESIVKGRIRDYSRRWGCDIDYHEDYVAWMTAQWQPFLSLVRKFQGVGSDNPVSEALREYKQMVGIVSIDEDSLGEETEKEVVQFPSNLIEENEKAAKVFIKNLRDPKRFHPDPSNPGDLIDDRNLRMTGSLETGWFQQARVVITAGERYGLPMIMFIPGGHAMLALSSPYSSFVEENGRIVEKLKVSVYNPSNAGVEEMDVPPNQPSQLSPFYTNFLTDAAFQDGSYNIHYWNEPALKEYRDALLNGKLAALQKDGWNCIPYCLFVNAMLHGLAPGDTEFKRWGIDQFYQDFGVRILTRGELLSIYYGW